MLLRFLMKTIARTLTPCLFLIIASYGFAAASSQTGTMPADHAQSLEAVGSGQTLAHTLLALELEKADAPALWQKLNGLIESAVARFGPDQPKELEPDKAQRFFRVVDEALVDGGAIFPPNGTVEMLRDALEPRQPAEAELRPAWHNFANARRTQSIKSARSFGEPLYYFDCDLAAVIYVAAAERLKLPVFLVELPGHNFVRWQSTGVSLNWDPNDGISKSDQHFAQVSGIAAEDRALLGYLENRTRERILSYWLVRRGQRKIREQNFAQALADFRAAVRTSPEDLVACNELAWLLATSPDPALRDGDAAREIAGKIVARARRINWLETLAAASAEAGDFPQAVALEEEARQMAVTWLQAKRRVGSLTGFDDCLKAYRANLSYASAVKNGTIK